MNIENQLKEFAKTDKLKKNVNKQVKSSSNFSYNTKASVVKFGEIMKKNLQDEVVGIKSSENDESFLNHIVVTEEFIAGVGWVVNVSFDEKFMHRNSLYQEKYPDGVLLNEIFNEGYNAKDYVYGIWHENNIRSRKQRDALYFIQQAVENFNSKYKGKAVALYNRKYSGGTL